MSNVLDRFKLDGKVAWITGGSSGLGLEIAKAYHEAGAKIVFNDVNKELVKKGLENFKKLGIDVYGSACDVTNEKQVTAFVVAVTEKVGPIDILVNNASIIKRIPMTEMTLEQWNAVVQTDLTGPFVCSKAVIPSMIERGGGKIINMLSVMSELGRETVSAYAAAVDITAIMPSEIISFLFIVYAPYIYILYYNVIIAQGNIKKYITL